MKLTVLIPVFNEINTIKKVIEEVKKCDLAGAEREIIVIDDCSTDGTRELLQKKSREWGVRAFYHDKNLGKGAGIKTGIDQMTGDVAIVQDADLEYHPKDIVKLIRVYDPVRWPVVYGSRNMGAKRGYFATHLAGSLITWLFNILYGTSLSDLHTGYKLFRSDLLRRANLQTNGFDFCHEVTAKMVKMEEPIVEVAINYFPRKWDEGKKVRAIDAVWDILTTIKLWIQR